MCDRTDLSANTRIETTDNTVCSTPEQFRAFFEKLIISNSATGPQCEHEWYHFNLRAGKDVAGKRCLRCNETMTWTVYGGDPNDAPVDHSRPCLWTERDENDGAMFSTACGERVEPVPGLQTYCHRCGCRVKAAMQDLPLGLRELVEAMDECNSLCYTEERDRMRSAVIDLSWALCHSANDCDTEEELAHYNPICLMAEYIESHESKDMPW